MARKKVIEESIFVDDISSIEYHWLKEETDRENNISCWLAEDSWGNKDHFVVSIEENSKYPNKVLKGPFRTIKETIESLNEKEEVVEENPIVDDNDGDGYVNAGLLDELYQLINLETENIRKCQELMCRADDAEKAGFIEVLDKIISAGNSNIGMLQEMAKTLSPTAGAVEKGAEEAKEILDNEETFDFEDDNEEEIDAEVARVFMDNDNDEIANAIKDRFAMDDLDDDELVNLQF